MTTLYSFLKLVIKKELGENIMIERSIDEINEKIKNRKAVVVTAEEMTKITKEYGIKYAYEKVDVVTTATFGAMCSSGVFLNFGHADPPIKMSKVWLNDVPAYGGIAAVDAYIGATEPSSSEGIKYGGAHVIEDLVSGKNILLKAEGSGTDCYPSKRVETFINIKDLNQAIMINPRNSYQKYNAATNTGSKEIWTYMGKLLEKTGNIAYSGSGELSPLANDPEYETIGLGTKIFLGGAEGYVIGSGTQHSPEDGFGTLMVKGDLKKMSAAFVRAATFNGYGCSLYIGIGIPIPLLNINIARKTAISDEDIYTNIVDYGIQKRTRPILARVNYAQLKSGYVIIDGKKIKTNSISSLFMARKVANVLKESILNAQFTLTEPIDKLTDKGAMKNLEIKKNIFEKNKNYQHKKIELQANKIFWDNDRCINCGYCSSICNYDVFILSNSKQIDFKPENCTLCGLCQNICPLDAIYLGGSYEN